MKFLFASDSFKGTLSSRRTAELLSLATQEIFPGCECAAVETADGGEGTTDAVLSAAGGEKITLPVHGPLGGITEGFYGMLNERQAIMEMASASGLTLIPSYKRDPRLTSSYGTGEMIADALERGCRDISIAVGGSATNDGGMGCMRALGVRFLDKDGNELQGCGQDLAKIDAIDTSSIHPLIKDASFTVMCDVSNPLCGENGATYTFGEQKGGTPEILTLLETGMKNYRDVILNQFGINMDNVPGSGAAGGLGAALMVFLNGELKSGIETVLDLVDFDRRLDGISLVVTGEGAADRQSVFGKVIQGVGMRCKKHNVPVAAITGSMGEGAEEIFNYGVDSIFTTINRIMPLEEALEHAEEMYLSAARRMFRLLKIGTKL